MNIEQRLHYVSELKIALLEENSQQDTLLQNQQQMRIRASFVVALQVATSSMSLSDGEIVKRCIVAMVQDMDPNVADICKRVPLSLRTITRRVNQMAQDTTMQLQDACNKFITFSLALDESVDTSGTPQLAIFIRGVDEKLHVTEELLDIVTLKETVLGEDVFASVEHAVESNNLDWKGLVSVATDGVPVMVGERNGFIGRLRRKMSSTYDKNIIAIHCLIHQQNLCAKSIALQNVMSVIVRVTNYIRNHGHTRRQFRTFLEELHSAYGELPYHTEVRW
ncbi:general transcription factor II-I repeat domain-containing protein 2-like [Osmia bicornis bicornis]|uniref:general transcription factor II-I repeat domain-containing protein 2-like n=1 Tax=Osmia bicornis bicornis TaxID=1437191 RepID=UPI001EAF7EB3|nr:general transcription factor II-I repeat domain-containing protein 2-like [Osmia bicornis bicornis]